MRLTQGGKFHHGFLSGGVYAEWVALQVIIKRYTLAVEIIRSKHIFAGWFISNKERWRYDRY